MPTPDSGSERLISLFFIGYRIGIAAILLSVFAVAAEAKPAVEVNLASPTAWSFKAAGSSEAPKSLAVPAGGWRLNGFPTATAGTYERRITVPKLPGGGPQAAF